MNILNVTSKMQFGRLPNKDGQELKKEQTYFFKNENNIYFSPADSSITKDEYYILKEGKEGWKVKKDVLQQYMVSRRAISDNYPKYKDQATLHVDILDFGKHNQYIRSKENVAKHELDPIFQYSVKAAKFTAACLKNNQGDNGAPLKCYLAKAGNKLQVGFIQFHDLSINEEKYIYIAELAIDPVYQRKGIGTLLIKMVLDSPNENKTPYLILTRSFNANAEALYKKLGFIQIKGEDGAKLVTGCGYAPNMYIALVKKV